MKFYIEHLHGPALDYAVAKCEGYNVAVAKGTGLVVISRDNVTDYFNPSRNWGWAGPIIDREHISLSAPFNGRTDWGANISVDSQLTASQIGNSALEAAMRCYVALKFGDTIDMPRELA